MSSRKLALATSLLYVAFFCGTTLKAQSSEPKPLTGKTILIDPGHGGSDPGTIASGAQEKDVVLAISLSLKEKLEELGATVVIARDQDVYLSLRDRLKLSIETKPDLFLCVHVNYVGAPSVSGIETYYHDEADKPLAETFLSTLADRLNDRAIKASKAGWFVLVGNPAPAILVEVGYLSSKRTGPLLSTSTYQNEIAEALAEASIKFLGGKQAATSPH